MQLYVVLVLVIESLLLILFIGSLSILNLQDISTPDDQEVKNAVFAFNTHPTPSPFLSLGYSVRLQWTAMSEEFSQYQRYSRSVHFPPESLEHCRRTSNVSLQQVGNGSYELTVPTAELGAGPLVISVSVSFACLDSWPRCTYCSQWRYTSLTSSSIAISAKRGRATHCSICVCCMTLCYLHKIYLYI